MTEFEKEEQEKLHLHEVYLLSSDYKMEFGGISITIPKNYYIEESPLGLIFDEISIYPYLNFNNYYVSYQLSQQPNETISELNKCYKDIYKTFIPFQEIEHNGLKAYHATCRCKNEQFYEVRFQVGNNCEKKRVLCLTLFAEYNNIEKIKVSTEFNELLNGIRKVETN